MRVALTLAAMCLCTACDSPAQKGCSLETWLYTEVIEVDSCWGDVGEVWSELRTHAACPHGAPVWAEDAPAGSCHPTSFGVRCSWSEPGTGATQYHRVEATHFTDRTVEGHHLFAEGSVSEGACVVGTRWRVERRDPTAAGNE